VNGDIDGQSYAMGQQELEYEEPLPAPPPRPPVSKLAVAQDALAAIGLVTGIVISGISLWALLSKYRASSARRPPPPG
jgi:hypothetical protein